MLTNKKKVFLAAAAFIVVFALFVYPLTIGKTLTEVRTCDSLIVQSGLAQTAELEIGSLQMQLKQLETKIATTQSDHKSYQEYLLDKISKYTRSHHLLITNFPAPNSAQEENMIIDTYTISIEGAYLPLLQLLYYIETAGVAAKVSGVVFSKQSDLQTQQTHLYMKLYIQTIATAKEAQPTAE